MNVGKMLFAENDGCYVLKLQGDVRLTLSASLETFLQTVIEKSEFRSLVIDLSEADSVDSTSLGLLAKLAIASRRQLQEAPVLVSPKEDITRILFSMGFEQVFIISEQAVMQEENFQTMTPTEESERTTQLRVIDAHKTLMALNDNNHAVFSDLVAQLENCMPPE